MTANTNASAVLPRLLVSYPELKPLGIPYTKEYIRRLTLKGKFPKSIRLGADVQNGHLFWRYADIVAWVDERAGATTPRPMKRPGKAQPESRDTRKADGTRVSRDAGKEASP
jgi:hypothetical protein